MKRILHFSKMQALGNDFMILDTLSTAWEPSEKQIQYLSDRHFGVGFDQLLIISAPQCNDYDFNYRIFNADGSEVGQCGNGARCAGRYIHQYLAPEKKNYRLKTNTTSLSLQICADNRIQLSLPSPIFSPKDIPFTGEKNDFYTLVIENEYIKFHALSVGNPHAVIMIENAEILKHMDIQTMGSFIENHPLFPQRCNVNFVSIDNPQQISIRVWERGCGETLACGSGALASAAIARKFYHLNNHINVQLKGGQLSVYWPELSGPIQQTGPAVEVFRGEISL